MASSALSVFCARKCRSWMSAATAVAAITSNVMALVSSDHLSIDIACNIAAITTGWEVSTVTSGRDHNRKRFTRSNEVAPVTSEFKLIQARTDADVSQRKTCAHHRQLTRDRTRHCSEVSGGWRDNRHSLLPERSSGKGNAGPNQRARCGGRDLSGGCDKARPDRTLV